VGFAGFVVPVVFSFDPYEIDLANKLAPIGTKGHFLGTDNLGRDLGHQLLWGARSSIIMAIVPIVTAILLGSLLGGIAAYWRGRIEALIMRTLDVFFALPPIVLTIGLAAALGPGLWNVVIALTVVLVPPMSRVVYQQVVSIRGMPFVEAARSMGASDARILRLHILPNATSAVITYGASVGALIVVLGAGLGFLGLGMAPPEPDWGRTINAGRAALTRAPHVSTLPGVGIFVLALGFQLVADGLQKRYRGQALL